MNYSPPPHRCMSMELFKLGYNTHILKIKMHILGHLETPPPQKNAPTPPGHSRICLCLVHTIPSQHYYY